jgi:lysophospholipase L1-like esterase
MRTSWSKVLLFCLFALSACSSSSAASYPLTSSGCSASPAPRSEAISTRHVVVPASDPHVLWVGRFVSRDEQALEFAWPDTQILLAFVGTSLSASISDCARKDAIPENDWLSVAVDDAPPTRVHLGEGRHDYVLAQDLAPKSHSVRIAKRTEAEVGTVTLHAFAISPGGRLLPAPALLERHIEVIGDSVSTGYGNEGRSAECHWSADTEDATRTYAAYAAYELGAQLAVAAWSGKGVIRNYDRSRDATMPEIWQRVLPDEPGSPKAFAPVPSVFVVNLGTNDFVPSIPPEQPFVQAYQGLLTRVHERAPHAPVVLVVPPTVAEDYPQPKARSTLKAYLTRIAEAQRARGHTVLMIEQFVDGDEGIGCDYHPNVRTHARLGHELALAIRELTGW